ncbi:MAG: 50S ribosomal protein L19 [Planctomycetes bacterium]|nr:50S ribosomal protein L19 [Planctomycetota bacterium]
MARNKAELVGKVEKSGPRKDFDSFRIGDTVDVHLKVKEGDKERIQVFTGLVISGSGSGPAGSFTVRRVVGEEGVERVFPYHSPAIARVAVAKTGKVRRSKLYYMRGRMGKQARIAERRTDEGAAAQTPANAAAPREPASTEDADE